jgi:hypothetical protein
MYQPISFNVIRQALDWHRFPVPALRQLSFFDSDPEQVTAEYLATWTAVQMLQQRGRASGPPTRITQVLFMEALTACFCEDVTAIDAYYDPLKEEFRVLLYVRLSREVIAAASGEWLSS